MSGKCPEILRELFTWMPCLSAATDARWGVPHEVQEEMNLCGVTSGACHAFHLRCFRCAHPFCFSLTPPCHASAFVLDNKKLFRDDPACPICDDLFQGVRASVSRPAGHAVAAPAVTVGAAGAGAASPAAGASLQVVVAPASPSAAAGGDDEGGVKFHVSVACGAFLLLHSLTLVLSPGRYSHLWSGLGDQDCRRWRRGGARLRHRRSREDLRCAAAAALVHSVRACATTEDACWCVGAWLPRCSSAGKKRKRDKEMYQVWVHIIQATGLKLTKSDKTMTPVCHVTAFGETRKTEKGDHGKTYSCVWDQAFSFQKRMDVEEFGKEGIEIKVEDHRRFFSNELIGFVRFQAQKVRFRTVHTVRVAFTLPASLTHSGQ